MLDGLRKLDMPESFPASVSSRDFHAAAVANHAIVFRSIVLTARTPMVKFGAKDTLVSERSNMVGQRSRICDTRFGNLTE